MRPKILVSLTGIKKERDGGDKTKETGEEVVKVKRYGNKNSDSAKLR